MGVVDRTAWFLDRQGWMRRRRPKGRIHRYEMPATIITLPCAAGEPADLSTYGDYMISATAELTYLNVEKI